MKVALAFGTNIGDRAAHLAFGRDEMAARGAVTWQAFSAIYETEPVGPVAEQGAFLNQVGVGETELAPGALLEICLAVERARGRTRNVRWGPRTLDLDILLYGDAVIDEPGLIIPHPEMTRRAFVMVPLAEVAPDWDIPGEGRAAGEIARTIDKREGVRIWRSSDTRPPT